MPPTRSTLIQTARSLILSYNTWHVPTILSFRSPTCIQHSLPSSRAQPPRNNTEYAAFFTEVLTVYRGFTASIDEDRTFVDVEARTVYLHVRSRAQTVVGEYANEYAFVIRCSEDGGLVDEVWEFMDWGYGREYAGRLREAGERGVRWEDVDREEGGK